MSNLLTVAPSPHAKGKDSVSSLMFGVLIALIPAFLCSLYFFGVGALITTLVSVGACVLFEWAITKYILNQKPHICDGSAMLTGVLLAFNLPSNINPGIVVFGALMAIGVAKMSFGGLGNNPFNPALVARVFLLISFPKQMTTWPVPGESRMQFLDAVTGPTPLSHGLESRPELSDLLMGGVGGSLGEVAALALVIGGIYMIAKKIITWHIPVFILLTVFVASFSLYKASPAADFLLEIARNGNDSAAQSSAFMQYITDGVNFSLYQLCAGGLMLGAFFMATDYVTSPMSTNGKIIYAVGIGLLTVIIRNWGGYPEGMSFAILIMNALTPIINKYVKPARFGAK